MEQPQATIIEHRYAAPGLQPRKAVLNAVTGLVEHLVMRNLILPMQTPAECKVQCPSPGEQHAASRSNGQLCLATAALD